MSLFILWFCLGFYSIRFHEQRVGGGALFCYCFNAVFVLGKFGGSSFNVLVHLLLRKFNDKVIIINFFNINVCLALVFH